MPIKIDENLRFVVQFDEIDDLTLHRTSSHRSSSKNNKNCTNCTENQTNGNVLSAQYTSRCSRKQFRENILKYFNEQDLYYIGRMTKEDLSNLLKKIVPCIGCRKSVETMFDLLTKKGEKIIN